MGMRYLAVGCVVAVVGMLSGCGSGDGALQGDPPGGGGAVMSVGQVQVEVVSAAGFKTTPLNTPDYMPYAFMAFWGSEIVRLQELGSAGKIAYDRDSVSTDIFVMEPDGARKTQLTTHSGTDAHPTWSPDGSQIAFQGKTDGDADIFVMNADGTGRTKVTNNTVEDNAPAWSPDGSKIALARFKGGDWEIYTMDPDGSHSTPLTANTQSDLNPAWSPDGRQIVYVHHDGTDYDLYTMNADGTGQSPLTSNSADDRDPAWSPDGSRIVFMRDNPVFELFTISPDGTDEQQLTSNNKFETEPAWSPDGRQIAFTRLVEVYLDVFVMPATGGPAVNVTKTGSHSEHRPAWSRTPTTSRTFVGPAGSDGGEAPPFGASRPFAVIGIPPTGATTALTITVSEPQWPSIDVKALSNTGLQLVGMKVTATAIKSFVEDAGRGIPARKWDLRGTPSTAAAIVYLDGATGMIRSIIGTADTALAVADAAASTTGDVTLRGSFTEAYDFRNPGMDLLTAPAGEVLLDGATGEVLAVN